MSAASSRDLIERARAGDPDAFRELVEAFGERLDTAIEFRLRRLPGSGIDPADVRQETLTRSWVAIERFEWRGESSFAWWLAGIAERVIGECVRQRRVRREGALAGAEAAVEPSPSRIVRRQERFERLEKALATLPPHYREALELVVVRGLAVKDAAEAMGRSANAVSHLLLRGSRELRRRFGDTGSLGLPADASLGGAGNDDQGDAT